MSKGYRLRNNHLYIFPLSDLHLGTKNCNLEYFETWEKVFNDTPNKKVIYLLGDLLDMPHTRLDPFSEKGSIDSNIELLLELLEPYKDYVRYCVNGNHENRLKKYFDFDITQLIANALDCPYSSNDFFDTFTVNGKPFTVYGKHGTRWSKSSDLAMRNFKMDSGSLEADLIMQGHNHYCNFSSEYIRNNNGGRRQYYAFTGNFLKYEGSYNHDRGSSKISEAFMRLELNKNLNLNCKIFNIDEVD